MEVYSLLDYIVPFTLTESQKSGVCKLLNYEQRFATNFLADPPGSGKTFLLVALLALLHQQPYRPLLYDILGKFPLGCTDLIASYLDDFESPTLIFTNCNASLAHWKTLLDKTSLKVTVLNDEISKRYQHSDVNTIKEETDVVLGLTKHWFLETNKHPWFRIILDDVVIKLSFSCQHLWTTSKSSNDSALWRIDPPGQDYLIRQVNTRGVPPISIPIKSLHVYPQESLWATDKHSFSRIIESPDKAWHLCKQKKLPRDSTPSLIEVNLQNSPLLIKQARSLSRCIRCLLWAKHPVFLPCCRFPYCKKCYDEIEVCPSCSTFIHNKKIIRKKTSLPTSPTSPNSNSSENYLFDPQFDLLCKQVKEVSRTHKICVFAGGSYTYRMLCRQFDRLNVKYTSMQGSYKTIQDRMKLFEGEINVLLFNGTKNTKGIHLKEVSKIFINGNVKPQESIQVGLSALRTKPLEAIRVVVPPQFAELDENVY